MKKPVKVLIHLAYWMMYILLLSMFNAILGFQDPRRPPQYGLLILMAEAALLPGLIAFYSFHTFLFSNFLGKRKVIPFVFFGLLIAMLTAIPAELLLYLSVKGAIWNFENCLGIGIFISVNAVLNGALGAVMRGFIEWYGDIKVKEDLNRKNYETELALVKSQINPHFLFNTLNNIDMLIVKEPQTASLYLNKLSDIMRFMLYETKTEQVALSQELSYIEKYIALQRIRSSNVNYVSLKITGKVDPVKVEPMLFIPFIENAFKHTEDRERENAIQISFVIQEDKISFSAYNVKTGNQELKTEHGGLGNELIAKRLALLYPGKHVLEIRNTADAYLVKLELAMQ